ncbi:hypothetical protein QCA50_011089 [Cerrena zonata]|uniref:Protein kinase domain-containing protein n=1 Tax=Cerrena zonata TaxID=2478898 RepID=A0AAW0G6X5_9APHY
MPTLATNTGSLEKVDVEESSIKLVRCRAFSDVFTAELDGVPVCVELVRWPEDLTDVNAVNATHAKILNKLEEWASLSHESIMPFKGYCEGIRGPLLGLRKEPDVDRLSLLIQCAEGLAYLHSRGIPHGDITSDNILISVTNDTPHAFIYGFGIPKILDGAAYSPALFRRGEVILPPELETAALTEPSISGSFTAATDVWSFGILAYQIFTDGKHAKVWESGGDPKLEQYLGEIHGMTPELWNIMQSCCQREPSERPSMDEVCSKLKELQGFGGPPTKDSDIGV